LTTVAAKCANRLREFVEPDRRPWSR